MNQSCGTCGAYIPDDGIAVCPVCMLDGATEGDTQQIVGQKLAIGPELGRGGMGVVHRAEDQSLGRTVAVKFLTEALADEDAFHARFNREARAMAMLNHPNIIAVHDFGRQDGRPYIVMEYAVAGSLADTMPLDQRRALEVAVQICDAVSYAHQKGIIHRDIKPQNILFDDHGRAKVSDFGLARLRAAETTGWTVTAENQAVGTPHYMAPEALRGNAPDPRMDVYAIGVVLYQMLTDTLPIGHHDWPPGDVGHVLQKALAQEPHQRYATVDELRSELASCNPDSAFEVPRLTTDQKYWGRGVALILSIATAVSLWAAMECLTPKVIDPDQKRTLVMHVTRALSDGRLVSPVRFETWPILGALAATVLAIFAYALLRRYWQQAGLEVYRPNDPLRQSSWALALGMAALAVYLLRKWLESMGQTWASIYSPLIGGLLEVCWLFAFWTCILESRRVARSLRREPLLWISAIAALLPPVREFVTVVMRGQP